MNSREKILAAVAANQPDLVPLPDVSPLNFSQDGLLEKLTSILTTTGSNVIPAANYQEIAEYINANYPDAKIVSPLAELESGRLTRYDTTNGFDFQDVELAIIKGNFAVAENGAIWVTEDHMLHRALPFITQHLIIVIEGKSIVPNMHEAYQTIGNSTYGFGTFISGPSKTADIEQSLVIGAHGARSLTVFLLP